MTDDYSTVAGGDTTQSPLFDDLLGGGGGAQGGMDEQTRKTLIALAALLSQSQGQGGRNFINPITQAQSLGQLQQMGQPIMGPQSSGVKYLFPGGSPVPPNPQMNKAYQQIARQAMMSNILDSIHQSRIGPQLMQLFANRGGGNQGTGTP